MNAFFIGIGGMGMSGLAKILATGKHHVAGSDRNLEGDYCKRLLSMGVPIYPQDGTGPETFMHIHGLKPEEVTIVKSTAVEDAVPDVVTARRLGMKEIMRSDLLADMFNASRGIAIGGTSGKTTTTGLIAWLLKFAGLEPSCAVGGIISGLETNAFTGAGPHFVIESDESDGSIVKYKPFISLITNITRDHKSLEELNQLFKTFSDNVREGGATVLCADDPGVMSLKPLLSGRIVTYGLEKTADVHPENVVINRDHVSFSWRNVSFNLLLPGRHNLLNALGALAVANLLGVPAEVAAAALLAFPGMKRRFEQIGTINGVTVVDDFAHNPAEIMAAIEAARKVSRRRFIVYQPHGFGPTRFTRDDLVHVFSSLQSDEFLYLDEIFYGGGTVEKDISAKDLVAKISERFDQAQFLGDRNRIVEDIVAKAIPGDLVLVMGARDINIICRRILDGLH
ncbi:MAG: UDP-N-acetylmuramate--L-alanine ligase [Candidatus Ozemobacteraceae bacterium]